MAKHTLTVVMWLHDSLCSFIRQEKFYQNQWSYISLKHVQWLSMGKGVEMTKKITQGLIIITIIICPKYCLELKAGEETKVLMNSNWLYLVALLIKSDDHINVLKLSLFFIYFQECALLWRCERWKLFWDEVLYFSCSPENHNDFYYLLVILSQESGTAPSYWHKCSGRQTVTQITDRILMKTIKFLW